MKYTISFFAVLILIVFTGWITQPDSFYYISKSIQIERWGISATGKWNYHSVQEIPEKSKSVINGTLELKDDKSFTFNLTEYYFVWNRYSNGFWRKAEEIIRGTVEGKWEVWKDSVIVMNATSCNLLHSSGLHKTDSTNCYGFNELGLGTWKSDDAKMIFLECTNDKAAFDFRKVSDNSKTVITMKRK